MVDSMDPIPMHFLEYYMLGQTQKPLWILLMKAVFYSVLEFFLPPSKLSLCFAYFSYPFLSVLYKDWQTFHLLLTEH